MSKHVGSIKKKTNPARIAFSSLWSCLTRESLCFFQMIHILKHMVYITVKRGFHFQCNQTWLEAADLLWAQMFSDSTFFWFPFFNLQQSEGEQESQRQLTTWVPLVTNFPLFAAQLANVNQQKKAHWLLKLICWANNHCESNLFLSLK